MFHIDRDTETLDGLVEAFYATISFPEGGAPDWERERKLYSPTARLTRMSTDIIQTFTVEEFQADLQSMITSGALPGFLETEIKRHVIQYADIAHLFSTYEGRRLSGQPEILLRGINSIQAYRREGRWWIASVLWFREGPANPIPKEFLP